jgi:hypothetical protein
MEGMTKCEFCIHDGYANPEYRKKSDKKCEYSDQWKCPTALYEIFFETREEK